MFDVRLLYRRIVFAAALLPFANPVTAQFLAYDDAANYFASSNWVTGANSGFGFTPWVIAVSGPDYNGAYIGNGYAIRSVTNVAGIYYPNCSWGIYAHGSNGTNSTSAYRGFAASLTTNVTFKLQWASKAVGNQNVNGSTVHGLAGFSLRNGNATNDASSYDPGARFDCFFHDGNSPNTFYVSDARGNVSLTNVTFSWGGRSNGTNGLSCEFGLEPNNTYRFILKDAAQGLPLAILDEQPLRGSGTIDSVALYAIETSGDQNFNRMQIVSNTAIPPLILNIQPTNGTLLPDVAESNVTFEVDSFTSTVSSTNVSLLLNGVLQALAFNTNGPAQKLLVTNTTPLGTNSLFAGAIIAFDAYGNGVTNWFTFFRTNALWYDVKSYSATGNGTNKDTTAIQNAINACAPGGFVWLHNGIFLSGTISLKDNMTLFIDPTATLFGSGSAADYPTQNPPTSNSQTNNCQRALVYAESRSNVAVDGGGTINGNGRTNFTSGVEATRPIAIWTVLCNHVALQNVSIVDAAMWTVVNMQSDYLTISNLVINDDGLNGNRDGCDVVDCWHVTIANCTIDSGDDSICLKSGLSSRGINDLVVKNCTITKSQSNGLKFGTASKGPFTNIAFQDCLVENTSHSAMAVESVDGSAISNITFQRINFDSCQNAIFIALGSRSGASVGSINGITFKDILGSSLTDTRGCPISGCFTNGTTYPLKNLVFNNVNIAFQGGLGSVPAAPPEYAGQYPENTMWGNLPAYGYYLRHVNGVVFTNCFTSAAATDARPWISTNDVSNLAIYGPLLCSENIGAGLALSWNNGFTLQTSTNVTGPFADLVGAVSPYTNPFTPDPRFFRLRQ